MNRENKIALTALLVSFFFGSGILAYNLTPQFIRVNKMFAGDDKKGLGRELNAGEKLTADQAVKTYLPVGMPKEDAISYLKSQGFELTLYPNSIDGYRHVKTEDWYSSFFGWYTYNLEVNFQDNKIISTSIDIESEVF